MTSRLLPLSAEDVARRLAAGSAVLIDIREADEFARSHARGAVSAPLSAFEAADLKIEPGRHAVFACRTGMRTGANCERLAARIDGEAYVLDGGLDAWVAARLPVVENRKAPLEIMRQVQITAGSLVLLGVVLGLVLDPAWLVLSGFIGAGLVFAGASGWCGMAKALRLAPWNRSTA